MEEFHASGGEEEEVKVRRRCGWAGEEHLSPWTFLKQQNF